jgi:Ca2+/Na+ antiporter
MLRRRPEFQGLRQTSGLFRLLRGAAFVIISAYLLILAIGPAQVWAWFSSTVRISHRDLALGIAGIAMTAWSGCLIAFVVRQRLTAELSRGLRFMLYAVFTPLVALTGSGTTLRTLALAVAMFAAFWAMLQLGSRPSLKMDFEVTPIAKDQNASSAAETAFEPARYLRHFIRDRFREALFGWQWSALLFALALTVFVLGSEGAVVGCSLVALFVGLSLAFVALILPSSGESSVAL